MNHLSHALDASDRRARPRVDAGNASFSLRAAERGLEVSLADFNEEGLGVIVNAASAAVHGNRLSLLALSEGQAFARMDLLVANVMRTGASWRVGGRLVDVAAMSSRALLGAPVGLSMDASERDVEILDSQLYTDVLSAVSRRRFRARLDGTGSYAETTGMSLGSLGVALDADLAESLCGLVVPVIVDVHGATVVFRGTLARRPSGDFALEGPLRIHSRARRRCDRVTLGRADVFLSWPDALRPGKRILAEVVELSATGARVKLARTPSAFPPPPTSTMALHVDGAALPVGAAVRHIVEKGDEYIIGLSLEFARGRDAVRIARHVERVAFPELRSRSDVPPASILALMEASGYSSLREAAEVAPLHAARDEDLSVDAVCMAKDGTPAGHASCTRIYSQTWLYHQLATLGQGRAAMRGRRALYLSMTAWVGLLAGTTGYSMAYFDRSKPWHRRFFESFVEFTRSDTLATIAPLDRFEWSSEVLCEPSATADVGAATPGEVSEIAAWAERLFPRIVVDAMDLRAEQLASDSLCEAHVSEGLERSRSVLAVREGGRLVGAALCETGSATISLFNILNMTQILVDPQASSGARRALLAAVRAHYASRGTSRPLIVSPPGMLEGDSSLTMVETMGCIVISAAGLLQYRNFLNVQLGRYGAKAASVD